MAGGGSRAEIIDGNLRALLESASPGPVGVDLAAPVRPGSHLTGSLFLELLESQFQARQLDLAARRLKASGEGYYTIASAGHEGNAAVAAALRPDDPAFLHYRSGGFFAQRARQVPGETPIFDVLLGLCAKADEPIAGGRHKVFGSRRLWIPPQTSTIASHLPKAMGTAFALERARHVGLPVPVPEDAIVVCSFGDASINHSTATGALNAAAWAAHQHLPMPILWVCEDNGIGISVHTPEGWVRATHQWDPDIEYVRADGLDLVDTYDRARAAVRYCREQRRPVFLHLELVRLLGHAGNDVELAYHDIDRIKATEERDPLLATCRTAIAAGLATPLQLLATYDEIGERVAAASREVVTRRHLGSVDEIAAPLAPLHADDVLGEACRTDWTEPRRAVFGGDSLPEERDPEHLAKLINWGLLDLGVQHPEMWLFGEDVARRGGVYGVTAQLSRRLGGARVFNTLLDEQSILGLAIGAGHLGVLPVPEIQYLAYLHNAADQIRGEAASLQYFSDGQFRNPMVVRVAAWGYQKGFGGHFHNDNAIGALRDIPGVVIACPSRGDDAVGMLRTCMALAKVDGRVVLFLEPIALYMTRDLHDDGDGGWRCTYPAPGEATPFGRARVHGEGGDLTIVSWGNGLWRSLRAARFLADEHGARARVVDLRWLQPFDVDTLLAEAGATGRVLIVDEGRRTGGLSEALCTALVEGGGGTPLRIRRVTGADTFIPLGPAWGHVLPDEEGIAAAALELLQDDAGEARE